MSDFSTESIVKANKTHRCSECHGAIFAGEKYERTFIVYDGDSSAYKTCLHCVDARNWLLNETDWPEDIDGEGHQWFYTMLLPLPFCRGFSPFLRYKHQPTLYGAYPSARYADMRGMQTCVHRGEPAPSGVRAT